jgi:hypothetical protein
MFYVGPNHWNLEQFVLNGKWFRHLSTAQAYAEDCKRIRGEHYGIIKIESVWTTKTLADFHAEGHL